MIIKNKLPQACILFAVLVALCFLPPAFSQELSHTPGEVRALLEKFHRQLERIDRLEKSIDQFAGIEKQSLEHRVVDRRLNAVATLDHISQILIEEKNKGVLSEKTLAAFEPIIKKMTDDLFAGIEKVVLEFKEGVEEAKSREDRFRTYLERTSKLEIIYTSLTAQILNQEALGFDVSEEKAMLIDHLYNRAESFSGMAGLADERRGELEQLIAINKDDVEQKKSLAILNKQLAVASDSFDLVIEQLTSLGFDASFYQGTQISLGGEITTDILDSEIFFGMLRKAWDKVAEYFSESGGQWVFNLLIALCVYYVFLVFSRLTRRLVTRSIESSKLNISSLMKTMIIDSVSRVVLILGLFVALAQIGISLAPLLAGLGVAGFIIGFALQDTLGNFASGMMILIYRPYDVGDMVEVAGGVFGKVKSMSLVSTTILTIDNETLVVPNSKIWGDVIKNLTAQRVRRVDMVFGIGYGDDIEKAERVLAEIVEDSPLILKRPGADIKLHTLNESSIDFVVRPWVKTDDYWDVYWYLTREVKLRFDKEGISIPFPQRDVHIHS